MYIYFLNLWCPWFLWQTLSPGLFSEGADLICSCKKLQLPWRLRHSRPTTSYIKGKDDPKYFLTAVYGDSHQIPSLSSFNSAKVNFHANIRCSDAKKRVCHIKHRTGSKTETSSCKILKQKKNSDGWRKRRRTSKENCVFFILQSTDQNDLTWGCDSTWGF